MTPSACCSSRRLADDEFAVGEHFGVAVHPDFERCPFHVFEELFARLVVLLHEFGPVVELVEVLGVEVLAVAPKTCSAVGVRADDCVVFVCGVRCSPFQFGACSSVLRNEAGFVAQPVAVVAVEAVVEGADLGR